MKSDKSRILLSPAFFFLSIDNREEICYTIKKENTMKKLLSIIFSVVMMFSVSSCSFSGLKEALDGEYNYSAQTLKIKERDCFAPCYFSEFLYGNEHTQEYFSEVSQLILRDGSGLIVTIQGEEWSLVKRVQEKLPEGIYNIVIDAPTLTMREMTDSGIIERACPKKITIPVSVSSLFEDKYSVSL